MGDADAEILGCSEMTAADNFLGCVTAEDDVGMLNRAYYETEDYVSLISNPNKSIVVGRRGSGKTAMSISLEKYWRHKTKAHPTVVSPESDQIIGVRILLSRFGEDFEHVKTGVKISWSTLLLLIIGKAISSHPSFPKAKHAGFIRKKLSELYDHQEDLASNLKKIIDAGTSESKSAEMNISQIAERLEIGALKRAIAEVLSDARVDVPVLVDKLDEGYKPDAVGVGLVAGIIQGTIEINRKFSNVRALVFIRDNMFKAVAHKDANFTRDIEGSALQIQWGVKELLGLVAARIRVATDDRDESDEKTWSSFVSGALRGARGFRSVLHLTLYRPRDLIALLNQAYSNATREKRSVIHEIDIESSSKRFSGTRLEDLQKEYADMFPSLRVLVHSFGSSKPYLRHDELIGIIETVLKRDFEDAAITSDLKMLGSAYSIVKNLYLIGFIGVKNKFDQSYRFCHDGASIDASIDDRTEFLVHPSYWLALNLSDDVPSQSVLEEINDEYDIERGAVDIDHRKRRVDELLEELKNIEPGKGDFSRFEKWCYDSLSLIFAGKLHNLELHPNKDNTQRRDIVGRNSGSSEFWKNIKTAYGVDQVIFEIKNYEDLRPDDYRQLNSYLRGAYGRCGFMISHSDTLDPDAGRDLAWIREFYSDNAHPKLIIRLTSKHLRQYLAKIVKPERYKSVDEKLSKILDQYLRRWLPG